MKRLDLNIDSATLVKDLTIGQQLIEIAKALSMQARIIIMDEPTSSLTLKETDRLLETIESLKQQGIAIIYISHRLSEGEAMCRSSCGFARWSKCWRS